ncbi:hypothetical protein AAVH_06185 [Aphelenchoides avenae]|nr:hypothetical protein AAVH_34298 [Aphelenchus avenae]KAH7726384.1 hypothetical protein AAVH_06185 [Aphelenchus avenae]
MSLLSVVEALLTILSAAVLVALLSVLCMDYVAYQNGSKAKKVQQGSNSEVQRNDVDEDENTVPTALDPSVPFKRVDDPNLVSTRESHSESVNPYHSTTADCTLDDVDSLQFNSDSSYVMPVSETSTRVPTEVSLSRASTDPDATLVDRTLVAR